MTTLIDALPGIRMPVATVTKTLREMWRVTSNETGHEAPSEFRASQMNLILHFGLSTSQSEAKSVFDSAVKFAQRYPCRIIVLCPEENKDGDSILEGKLFSQCFIGLDQRQMCCCEALILSYPTRESSFLDNQVSIWLESELPTYVWTHKVPIKRIKEYYLPFLRRVTRVVYDSSIEPEELSQGLISEESLAVKDLATARTLPVRQSIGQFLSAYEPSLLLDGLSRIKMSYKEKYSGEAHALLEWQKQCLTSCAKSTGQDLSHLDYDLETADGDREVSVEIEWEYNNGHYFSWSHRVSSETASIQANIGHTKVSYPLRVKFIAVEEALAEAMFF